MGNSWDQKTTDASAGSWGPKNTGWGHNSWDSSSSSNKRIDYYAGESSIGRQMQNIGWEYIRFRNENIPDALRGADLALKCTQSYYEGEEKAIGRRKMLGVDEQLHIKSDYNGNKKPVSNEIVTRNELMISGEWAQSMKIERVFKTQSGVHKKFKDHRMFRLLFHQPATRNQEVSCPNCGSFAKIETYVDGCDYCGSKFEISDFACKIAGCSTYFNLSNQNRIPFFIVTILMALSMSLAKDVDALKAFPIEHVIGIVTWVAACAISWGMYAYARRRSVFFKNSDIVENIAGFKNLVPFGQTIEQRIKCMMMSDQVQEAVGFTNCDMRDFLAAHRNVVDVEVEQIEFLKVRFSPDQRFISIDLHAKTINYYLENQTVKRKKESLLMTVTEPALYLIKEPTSIKMHKCPGCGNSINIFHGGICDYCNQPVDKYALGWIVERLSFEDRSDAKYTFMNVMCYILCIGLMFGFLIRETILRR